MAAKESGMPRLAIDEDDVLEVAVDHAMTAVDDDRPVRALAPVKSD
jgi:hypothetical protein